jgi:NAD(P)-dependent dehydrogenase (short-subunit alcohol dehydrogenase family)
MTSKFADKVALVTGGSSGIGLGIAKSFAEEGACVFVTGRRQSQLDKAVASIGGDAAAGQGDTPNLADLDRVYAIIQAQAGRIGGLYEFGTFGEITEEHFDKTFNTNVRGLLFTVQKALPLLWKGFLGDPHWLDGINQGARRLFRAQCVQSRGTLVRAHMDGRCRGTRGSSRSRNASQRLRPLASQR